MVSLFFSYSHKDEGLRNELEKHLSILKRQKLINTWYDRCINAGSEFDPEISNHLKKADIILLLISPDFLDSDYCYDKEMNHAIELHAKKEAVVIPVILRPCDWQNTLFGKLQAVPRDNKPVIKFPILDDAFLEITNEIKRVIQTISIVKESTSAEQKIEYSSKILPRSSNLRIAKKFSDHEKDKFLDDAFEYIANYFEGSLKELKKRNPQVDYLFKRIDSQTFSASIYIDGSTTTECMIFSGGPIPGYAKSISYSHSISRSHNSFNESLNVSEDGYNLYLQPLGMSMLSQLKNALTHEGAAEYYWERFIEPVQRK